MLLFVGDSIQEEFYFTLLASLWHHNAPENCNPSYAKTVRCGGHEGVGGSFRVRFIRNDHLTLYTGASGVRVEENAWVSEIAKEGVTMLLLNRGAHYVADDKLLSELRATLQHIQTHHPTVRVIYRNTPAGHLDFSSRFDAPPLHSYATGDSAAETGDTFHYSQFERQNNLARRLLRDEFPQSLFLDVYTPTVLRADAHPDPLHYCLPGPIDTWWTAFEGAAGAAKCGGGEWMKNYTQMHKAALASKDPRLFVSTSGGQGATDRLVGHLTGFYAAVLSGRAYVLDSYGDSLTFDAAFDSPVLASMSVPEGLQKEVHEAWELPFGSRPIYAQEGVGKFGLVHYHDGFPMFTDQFPREAYEVIFGPKPILILSSNRGNIYNLIRRSNYSHVFEQMRLPPKYGVYCAFHYLFRPNQATLQLARPYSSQLADADNVVRIGIQIRTGDFTSFWARSGHSGFKILEEKADKYSAFFSCAEMIERMAKELYGAKLITDTESLPLHTGINAKNGQGVMRQIMSEVLTLSLCDYFALTFNSGVGKLAAWISPHRDADNVFIVEGNSCRLYNDEEMAVSNQGI